MFTTLLKITSFYKDFLNNYYQTFPQITGKSYDEQYKHLMAQGYGYADYFPRYLEKIYSIKASEIVHNAVHLQGAWAAENNIQLSGDELLLEQIRSIQPEVLFIQDSSNFDAGCPPEARSMIALKTISGTMMMAEMIAAPKSDIVADRHKGLDGIVFEDEAIVADASVIENTRAGADEVRKPVAHCLRG